MVISLSLYMYVQSAGQNAHVRESCPPDGSVSVVFRSSVAVASLVCHCLFPPFYSLSPSPPRVYKTHSRRGRTLEHVQGIQRGLI